MYERHLRSLRARLKKQVSIYGDAIEENFPGGTRVLRPQGGLLLWVQLPGNADSFEIYKQALAHRISILPGVVFSPSGQFADFIRIGCGFPFSRKMARGLKTLGALVQENLS